MRDALVAEWTKARTLPSTLWLLLGAAALTVGVSAAFVATSSYQPFAAQDLPKLSLTGIDVGQAGVAVLAVLAMGNEYHTAMVRVTLTAMPRRIGLLGAKATTLTALVVAGSAASVGGCLALGRFVLPGNGFTVAHGYALLSLGQGSTLRAAGGSVLYLALVGLLSLGVATAVRDTATAIATTLGLLYLFPLLAHVVSDATWQRHLEQLSPMTAGLAIQATTDLRGLPLSPWAGLGVLAAWAAGALLVGGTLFRLRDA